LRGEISWLETLSLRIIAVLNFYRRFIWLPTLLLCFVLELTCAAQSPNSKPATPAKPGQESCDGALDIVPSKSATFIRKRRPKERKPVAKPENKSEIKSSR
jgi:hypothetical protein